MTNNAWRMMLVAVAMLSMTAAASWAQGEVSAGYDLFTTDPTTTDLLGIPFMGDASVRPTYDFVPPPDSADGRRAIGDTDTIVHRMQDASVPSVPGTADPIAIELVLLRLVSTIEFDLDNDGSSDGRVYVTLQKDRDPAGEVRLNYDPPPMEENVPPPSLPVEEQVLPGLRSFGEMTITFDSALGGSFDSRLQIYADLRIGRPDGPIVCGENAGLPPCSDFDAGLILESTDSAWGREALPESITIRGVNFSLAAPDRNSSVDSSKDFWAGIDPAMARTVCVAHGGHPDPGGLPTAHGTCRTVCTTEALALNSCLNGKDDDCNGTIDDCDEDLFGPVVVAPADQTFECPQVEADLGPGVTGFGSATDNCFPPILPAGNISFSSFRTDGCGKTFLIDRIWTAKDDCGNDATMPDLQQIHVVDTTYPEIACPEEKTILWTADRGPDSLGYATGADTCGSVGIAFSDESVEGICRSEDVTRTWTATDECGLETPCGQLIFVRGPRDAIEDLRIFLLTLDLPQGCENSLSMKLENAVDDVCGGNPNAANAALGKLGAFINDLGNGNNCSALDPNDASTLVARAEAIIAAIEDPINGGVCPEGCGDDDDDDDVVCPGADQQLIIGDEECGVLNFAVDDDCTLLSDRIAQCAEGARNPGQFQRCVADFLNSLPDDVFSEGGRGQISSCAARSNLP